MKGMKKAVCLAMMTAIMLSNSAMAEASIRIGGYLDQTDCDVLLIALRKGADRDSFSGADVSFIRQQSVGKDGYFTMELPLLDSSEHDFYSNAGFIAVSPDGTHSEGVYVSSAGDDTNDGVSADTPVATLEAAYKRALALKYEKIIIMSDMDYVQCPLSYEGSLAIEGYTGTEKLNITANTMGIAGDTIFSKLVINSTVESGTTSLFANGFNLTIKEDVTMPKRIGVFGGKYHKAMTGDTHLTILGGRYSGIWGGGLSANVTGNTYVTIGGSVNAGDGINDSDSEALSPCYAWGGGSNASVIGETHITLKDNAVTRYVSGGSEKSKGKEKKTHISIEGGKVMNVYGGTSKQGAADLESCDTYITMTGGIAESIFGGSENNSMTGNTYVDLRGGEVTRRVYTGCYNNYGFGWSSDNYVKGTTNLIISPNAKVNTKTGLSGTNTLNMGVFSGSRTEAAHTDEKNTIIYLGDSMGKFEAQIGDVSGVSAMKSFENYVVDVKTGGTAAPTSTPGVIQVIPDKGNDAYVDNEKTETETVIIPEGKTVVVEFSGSSPAPLEFKINSLEARPSDNDGINVTADIGIGDGAANGPHTIIAIYDDAGKLMDLQLDYSMKRDVFEFGSGFKSGKTYTIKAMIWDNGIKPLTASYTISFPKQ
ncbi:MAG: hypothetical protein J6N52_10530 [Clostridia bacterium]|nr:hypothetical protein [Clostridia bacterium]